MIPIIFRTIAILIIAAILTVLTQTGGLILLLCLPLFWWINKKTSRVWKRAGLKVFTFTGIYLIFTLLIIPGIAKSFGRVPLPLFSSHSIKPLNIFTCLANRHYVRPPLFQLIQEVSINMNKDYPGTVIAYMDANFPFWDGFPLIPHLSHSDGKKMDVAFLYKDKSSGKALHRMAPTIFGYGSNEHPRKGETDMPAECQRRGYKLYGFLSRFAPPPENRTMIMDEKRTASMLRMMARHQKTGKIFLEPHLQVRLKVSSLGKIRFHGCQAVRHDDHLHLQL